MKKYKKREVSPYDEKIVKWNRKKLYFEVAHCKRILELPCDNKNEKAIAKMKANALKKLQYIRKHLESLSHSV